MFFGLCRKNILLKDCWTYTYILFRMEFSENYLDKILSSAIDYYQYQNISEQEIPLKLDNFESAISFFRNSLRNEAHRSMTETTSNREPLLHAVNLNTGSPGIITKIDSDKSQVSIYINNDLNTKKSQKKKKKYKSVEQLEKIAEQKFESLQKKKEQQQQRQQQKKEQLEDNQNLKENTKNIKQRDKQITILDKEMSQLELKKKDKKSKLDSISQDPEKSQKYQKTVDRLQKSLAAIREKEEAKQDLKQQLKDENEQNRQQINNLEQKKQDRENFKQKKKQEQEQLKEERRMKRLEKKKLKEEKKIIENEEINNSEYSQDIIKENNEINENNENNKDNKKRKPKKKIKSLDPSEIMDELYDCLDALKSDVPDNENPSIPLTELTLYPSPIPFERHLSSLDWCNPNPVLLPTLLYGSNNYGDNHIKLIHGPPGTGKTYRLILELKKILEINNREKVLLCAPSNIGVINMYNRALSMGVHGCLVLSSNKIPDNFKFPEKQGKENIIFTTISMRFGSILNNVKFSTIILDEACQCQEAWTWGLLRSEVSKIILAGDPQQLPALVSDVGKQYKYERSLMSRLIELGVDSELLSIQRRMHPEIVDFSNNCFYQGKLSSDYQPFSMELNLNPIEIINVPGQEQQVGTSYININEVDKVIEIEKQLSQHFNEIIVISPYKEHCHLLKKKNKKLNVHTIDSFQGKEAEAVILTTVRTGDQIGFWNDYRRLNVGMTRAKHVLRIIGNISTWSSSNGPLKKLLDFYQKNNSNIIK